MSGIARPQWIAKMYASKSGQDHLGLGSVSSDQILPHLSPGINVLTIHPRYHSFYVFLLDEFWRRDRARSSVSWVQFYRPREFIFSVGVFLCDQPSHTERVSAVGGKKTKGLAQQQRSTYDTSTNYIKNDLGGYGHYYRSVMAELGLIYLGGSGFSYPVDVPTERGKQVAAAFRQAMQETAYYHDYFDHDITEIPRDVIQEYIHHACLCQLQNPSAPDRPLLLDTFLHEGGTARTQARRETFQLLLDVAAQTSDLSIDEDAFRQLLYFRSSTNGAAYHPQSLVEGVYKCWRLYQAREYYAFALNTLWNYFCHWGLEEGGDTYPLPLHRFWQHLYTILNFDHLAHRLQLEKPGLVVDGSMTQLLQWLLSLVNTDWSGFDTACTLNSPIHEHKLYQMTIQDKTNPAIAVAGMIVMLCLIYLRFGHPECWQQPEWLISRMGYDERLSVDGFVQTMHQRLQHNASTIKDTATWLYRNYIVLQHEITAESKLPENTYRFQREGDRFRFYRLENSLSFVNSRFNAISTTIHELGFCGDFLETPHLLTSDGEQLLAKGDLQ